MDLITLPYIFLCLVLVFFFFAIPPSVRRRYSKYDDFEKIKAISKKHNIMKPGYLMFNLDYQHEDVWYYRWISSRSQKIPHNKDAPILFLKRTIASIENKEEKKIYTGWLINQLSEKAQKYSDRKAYYDKLEKSLHKIYDNIESSDFSTQEKINSTIENTGGRPADFEKEDTEKWFNELSKKPEYQHSDGKPFINIIVQEIIARHEKKTGIKPSESTIDSHRRKLGLMQNR